MIKRIIEIKDIGRFDWVRSASGNEGDFAKVNVVYAPNACGKTTLCDVFRSLGTSNPAFIVGRKRLGISTAPAIDFLSSHNSHWKFRNGQWNPMSDCPHVFVYDQRFVKDNVLVGGQIGVEQKRNVYNLALGQKAVELNQAVQDAGDKLTRATEVVSQCTEILSALIPPGQQIETFRRLEPVDNVDVKIAELKERIAIEKNKKSMADLIRSHGLLKKISIPLVPNDDLVRILSATLDSAALTAESKIQEHLARCTSPRRASITWIKEGYETQTGPLCPYCGQDMSHTNLLATYKAFFSGTLKQQETQRTELKKRFQTALGEQAQYGVSNVIAQNSADQAWWNDACDLLLELPPLNADDFKKVYTSGLHAAQAAIERKLSSLAVPISLHEDEILALNAINSTIASIQTYNDAIENGNAKILEFRNSIEDINIDALTNSLSLLELQKARQSVNIVAAYKKYDDAVTAKEKAQDVKTVANEALKQESQSVFDDFGTKINEILATFGVDFTVENDGVNLRSKTAAGSLSIKLIANGTSAQINCSSEAAADPTQMSLANTLSGGDCSALGLAFFLAKLESDEHLASAIVVIDDPYHDQDRSRQAQTISLLKRKANECSQFFLLSHNLEFAQLFMSDKGIPRNEIRAFEIPQLITSIELKHGGLPQLPSKSYETDYSELSAFVTHPEQYQNHPKEIVGRIRPLLETYLRYKYPLAWREQDWLGDMIGKIRLAQPNDTIYPCNCLVPQLEDINTYTQRFHHRVTGVSADVPDLRELRTYVKLTLEIVHHA